jgi:hypothetical protein
MADNIRNESNNKKINNKNNVKIAYFNDLNRRAEQKNSTNAFSPNWANLRQNPLNKIK